MREREAMIDYRSEDPIPCWTVTVHQAGVWEAHEVQNTPEAALGTAMLALKEIFESDFVIDMVPLGEAKWLIRGTSTLTGYPVPAEVEAYVLPSVRRD